MEGCLYRKTIDNRYYLITATATYTYIAVEFETFSNCFIQNENFEKIFENVKFTATNIKQLLDNFDTFNGNIDYSNLDELNQIIYNGRMHIIKNWMDIYNFAAGRF